MSLRSKFILALLVSSLATVALVGSVAYSKLSSKFDETMRRDAFQRFGTDVVAYLRTYGSWQQGTAQEPFGHFAQRHGMRPGNGPEQAGAPEQEPPPPTDATAALPPVAPDEALPRGPNPDDPRRAPFRFVVFDTNDVVQLPTPPYQVGDKVSAADKARALAISMDGKVVAYAVPQGLPTLSGLDRGYLVSMRDALLAGAIAALALALVLGISLGNVLSRTLRKLTEATQAMTDGTLRQRVAVDSRDEVGVLARAFNHMSEELTRSHEELLQTNETIRQQAEQLRELSIRDVLTQLYNRRHFDEYAARLHAEAVRYQRPLTVVIGDIDFFKRINDGYSHATGDAVLRQVAELIRRHSRASDVPARYGGEEFVLALAETALLPAAQLCEQLRAAIENHPWETLAPGLRVTMSMGLCDNTALGDVEAMLRAADEALYQAKNAGRNQVRVAESLAAASPATEASATESVTVGATATPDHR
jgi:diguanylate cyclase (GGDEF)-like protein